MVKSGLLLACVIRYGRVERDLCTLRSTRAVHWAVIIDLVYGHHISIIVAIVITQ